LNCVANVYAISHKFHIMFTLTIILTNINKVLAMFIIIKFMNN